MGFVLDIVNLSFRWRIKVEMFHLELKKEAGSEIEESSAKWEGRAGVRPPWGGGVDSEDKEEPPTQMEPHGSRGFS